MSATRRTRSARSSRSMPPEDPAGRDPEPDPHDVARQMVLRQLTMAPRSRAELEKKLAQRGCDEQVARVVLDRMEEVGLVDDEAYAGMLVRSRQSGRGLARRALRAELRKKGVQTDVIEEAVGQVSEDDERDEARRLVDKKLRGMAGLDAQVQARRLAGMLARKGYGGEVAYSVIREAIRDAPEHQRD
ncbi:MAG: regulatory protein RecX [Austwickia sp.]|nr:regulatory protein RecX [Austwickia sp.]